MTELRPPSPRPAPHGGPRSRRCTTHYRAWNKARKAKNRTTYVAKTFTLTQSECDELWAFQGERCICGRRPSRAPDVDHDHACCAGPNSCGKCVRGFLCRQCNREVLGRYNASQLRALADYLDFPPMARLRAAQLKESA
jgi:hypothetical protein